MISQRPFKNTMAFLFTLSSFLSACNGTTESAMKGADTVEFPGIVLVVNAISGQSESNKSGTGTYFKSSPANSGAEGQSTCFVPQGEKIFVEEILPNERDKKHYYVRLAKPIENGFGAFCKGNKPGYLFMEHVKRETTDAHQYAQRSTGVKERIQSNQGDDLKSVLTSSGSLTCEGLVLPSSFGSSEIRADLTSGSSFQNPNPKQLRLTDPCIVVNDYFPIKIMTNLGGICDVTDSQSSCMGRRTISIGAGGTFSIDTTLTAVVKNCKVNVDAFRSCH